MASRIKEIVRTTPVDKRFDNSNQMNHCWNRYNEWLLCLKQTNGDEDYCAKARQFAVSMCPVDWVETWDDQRDAGNFLGVKFP